MFNQIHLRRRFESAAITFDKADFLHAASRDGLMARMAPLLVDAETILDLGAATGSGTRLLEKRFRGARVTSLDIAHGMLKQGLKKKSWLSKSAAVQANAERLPFATGSFDVVFCNQLLPCVNDLDAVFAEVARVLNKGGVFAFASLGPDSLQELRRAWHSVDQGAHVSRFPDMHDIGDGVVNAGLSDPVLDVDRLVISYENAERLFADLTAVGARNFLSDRFAALSGRTRMQQLVNSLKSATAEDRFSLSFELVYGHCWGAGPKQNPGNFRIDAGSIPLRPK